MCINIKANYGNKTHKQDKPDPVTGALLHYGIDQEQRTVSWVYHTVIFSVINSVGQNLPAFHWTCILEAWKWEQKQDHTQTLAP